MDISRLSEDELAGVRNKKIGFVFQDFNLLHRADALSNVELPLIYAGRGRGRSKSVAEALARVGLTARAGHKPYELSGGEQQRVAIARALVNDPELILADEPTGNLDSATAEEIVSILRHLNQGGITVILVTHEMNIALRTRRIIRLADGRIVRDEINPEKDPFSRRVTALPGS